MDTNGLSRREFMKVGGISLAATTVALNFGSKVFAASSKTPFGSVQFAVITDPHVDIRGTNAIKMSSISLDCVQKTVEALNMEKDLSFVMVTGDLLQDGEWENARAIKKELDQLKAPYYVLAGNHDYDPILPKKHREGFTYMTIEEFVEFFKGHGYDDSLQRYYALQIKPGLRVIALDAELPLDPKSWAGVVPAEQLEWLDKQLADHPNDLNLVCLHHNFVTWSDDELKGGPKQRFCIENAAEVREVLAKHSTAAPVAISGHRHIGLNYKELNGVNYFIAPALNSHPMRYTIFDITNEAISWKTPMVGVPLSDHLEAKENLLNAEWWRESKYKERNYVNDNGVLALYENNDMIIGTKKI
jgi:3',5'-cyclic AMP phosphodiesterase CpdA